MQNLNKKKSRIRFFKPQPARASLNQGTDTEVLLWGTEVILRCTGVAADDTYSEFMH